MAVSTSDKTGALAVSQGHTVSVTTVCWRDRVLDKDGA